MLAQFLILKLSSTHAYFKQVSKQKFLILFYFITAFGSSLSSVSTFFSIDPYFKNIYYIGIALGARTLAAFLFSYLVPKIIAWFGISRAFILSQIFGGLSLIVLLLGFQIKNFALTLLGIMLTGLPGVLVAILLSITFKLTTKDESLFRKYSGNRELSASIALLLATAISPLLLLKFKINFIILIDAISYVLALILLHFINVQNNSALETSRPLNLSKRKIFLNADTVTFYTQISISLLLAGLIPLLSSSSQLGIIEGMPKLLQEWLWLIEQLTGIIACIFYVHISRFIKSSLLSKFLLLNSVWLCLLQFNISYAIFPALAITSFFMQLSFLRFRDDLILMAGNDSTLIHAYSAITLAQKNFIYFFSPLLLATIFNLSKKQSILIMISLQLILYLTYIFIRKFLYRDSLYNRKSSACS
ncbi:MAG TPA: hypothetical protein VHE99_09350 [Gammaproteobacteria bacterium]|nr:hypothetical protein [Gammaproteobacteria bacterium]